MRAGSGGSQGSPLRGNSKHAWFRYEMRYSDSLTERYKASRTRIRDNVRIAHLMSEDLCQSKHRELQFLRAIPSYMRTSHSQSRIPYDNSDRLVTHTRFPTAGSAVSALGLPILPIGTK